MMQVVPRDSTLGGGNAAAPRASALSTAGHQPAAAPSDPAHVHLTLTGHRLRYFTAILSTVVKMCESVHLEPMQDALLVRAVAPTRTTHLLAVLDSKASFDRFSVHVPWELPDGTPIANSDPTPPTLKLLGKSIAMTALRHGSSTQSLEIKYDAAISHDHVQIIITSQTGLVRNYQLNLQESTNEKAHVDNRFYRFECVADPKTWGSYINSLCPSSGATQGKLAIVPTSSRLVMRAYGAASDGTEMFTGGSTSISAQNRPTFGSMVSVEQNQFLFYSYPAPAAQANNNSSTQGGGRDSTSSLHNAASVCTLPSQPNPTSTTNNGPQVSLPGKSIELKPLRQFLRVCEALGLKTRLMTGVEGIPVFLEGVSKEGEPPVRHLSLLVAALDSNEGNASSSSASATTTTGESATATSGGGEGGGVSGVVVGGAGRGSRLSSSSTSGPPQQHPQLQAQHQHQEARDETQHHQVVAPPRRVLSGGGIDEQQPSVVMADSSVSMHHQRSSSSAISQAPSGTNIGGDSTIMYSLGGGGQQYDDASPSVAPRPPANTRPLTGAPPEVLGGAKPQSILRKSGGSGGQQPVTTTTTTTSYQPHHQQQQQGVSSSHPLQNHSETFPHVAEEESAYQDEDHVAPSASMGGASSILAPPTPQHQQHGDGRSVSYVPATARSSPGGDFGGRPSAVLDGVGPSQTGSVLSHAASSILAPPSGVLSTSFSQSAARRRQQQRSNNQSQVPSSQFGMASSSESFVPSSQKGPSSQHHRPDLGNVLSSPVKRDDGAQDIPSPVREPYHPHQQQQQQQRPPTSPQQQVSGDSYASSSSPSVPTSSAGGGVVERLSFGEGSNTVTSYPSGASTTPDAVPSSHNNNIQRGALHHHHHLSVTGSVSSRIGGKRDREEIVVDGTPPGGSGQGWSTPRHVPVQGVTSSTSPNHHHNPADFRSPIFQPHRHQTATTSTSHVSNSRSPNFVPGTEERLRLQPTPLAVARGTAPPVAAPPPGGANPSMTPAEIAAFYSQFVIASSSDDDNDADM